MKTFTFIVKQDETGKQDFDLKSEGFSVFEISGFAKYLEIQSELEIIGICKEKPKKIK